MTNIFSRIRVLRISETGNLSSKIENAGNGSGGLTAEQASALDGLLKIVVYTEDASAAYASFRAAFGLEDIPATGITLSASTISFASVEVYRLVATVEPADSTDSVVWSTSDSGVATVDNGVVTPVANGSCTITATAGSVSAQCAVTVAFAQEAVTYNITNDLTNVTNSNTATSVSDGYYSAVLTADDGYSLSSVVITMGGVDVTAEYYSGGDILIPNVTGDLVITAIAYEISALDIYNYESEDFTTYYCTGTDISERVYFNTSEVVVVKSRAAVDATYKVVATNNTDADVSVTIYYGDLRTSDATLTSGLVTLNAVQAKSSVKVTPGSSISFDALVHAGYYPVIVANNSNLDFVCTGNIQSVVYDDAVDLTLSKNQATTVTVFAADGSDGDTSVNKYYRYLAVSGENVSEDTNVEVIFSSDTDVTANVVICCVAEEYVSGNITGYYCSNIGDKVIRAGLPAVYEYTVKSGYRLCVLNAGTASISYRVV